MLITIYQDSSIRARVLCEAMARGIVNAGHRVRVISPRDWQGAPEAGSDCALFYGLKHPLRDILNAYTRAGLPSVFLDLGYWGRKPHGNELEGFHRFSVGDYHPTKSTVEQVMLLMDSQATSDLHIRPSSLDLERPRKTGAPRVAHRRFPCVQGNAPLLVVGMSEKGAWVYDLEPEEYERAIITGCAKKNGPELKIIYRPKPSWKDARPIEGAAFDQSSDINDLIKKCWRVVTHHSNVCVEAAVHDVACYSETGPGVLLNYAPDANSTSSIPATVRQTFVDALSHFQYSVPEMRNGTAWRFIEDVYIPIWQYGLFNDNVTRVTRGGTHVWGQA